MFYYLLGPIYTLPWHGASSAVSNLHLQEAGLGETSPDSKAHLPPYCLGSSVSSCTSFYTNMGHTSATFYGFLLPYQPAHTWLLHMW